MLHVCVEPGSAFRQAQRTERRNLLRRIDFWIASGAMLFEPLFTRFNVRYTRRLYGYYCGVHELLKTLRDHDRCLEVRGHCTFMFRVCGGFSLSGDLGLNAFVLVL